MVFRLCAIVFHKWAFRGGPLLVGWLLHAQTLLLVAGNGDAALGGSRGLAPGPRSCYDGVGVIAQPTTGGGEQMHSFYDLLGSIVSGLYVRIIGDWLANRFWRR